MENSHGTNATGNDTTHLFKTFKRRPGTVNLGHHYENKIVALLSLRCAASGTDTWIATNVDCLNAFDDIFIFRQTSNGCYSVCVQLKHRDKSIPICNCEFKANQRHKKCERKNRKKDFMFSKYEKSFQEISGRIKNPSLDEDPVIRLLRQSSINVYVLFTNRPVGEVNCLNEITNGVHQFNKKISKNRSFLEQFFLLSSQAHVNQLDDIIEAEIKRSLASIDITDEILRAVAEKFIHFISTWSESNADCPHFLTNRDVINELTYMLLTPYITDLSHQSCCCRDDSLQYTLFNKIVVAQPSTVIVNYDKTTCQFLMQFVSCEVANYYDQPVNSWGDRLCPDALNRLRVQYQELGEIVKGDLQHMSLRDLYKYLWFSNKVPLLVEVQTVEAYSKVLQISKLPHCKLKLIIINKSNETLPASNDAATSLQVKDRNLAEELLWRPVRMQGRAPSPLQELITYDQLSHMTFNDVIHLLCQDLRIGNDLQGLEEFFVERRLSCVFLAREVLKAVPEELFLIRCSGKIDFGSFDLPEKVCYPNEICCNNLNNYQVIFFDHTTDPEQLVNAVSADKIIHHLLLDGSSNLKWCKSRGGVKSIRPYRLPTENNDFCPLRTSDNSVTIISAGPGTGKTVLMDCLAHLVPTNVWVLKVDLYQHRQYYKNKNCKSSSIPATEHLFWFYEELMKNYTNSVKLTKAVFTKCMAERRILLLLDGFDEVSYLRKEEVMNMIKSLQREGFQMWITTRPHMESYLAGELHSFPLFLKPFSVEDQRKFLNKYFCSCNRDLMQISQRSVVGFVNQLLETAKNNLSTRDIEFTGIPLQTKLLADFYNENCREYLLSTGNFTFYKHFDLLTLYHNFVETKINLMCAKYGDEAEKMYKVFEEDYSLLAMNLIFPESGLETAVNEICKGTNDKFQLIQTGGLIAFKDSNVTFVHRTFAEYLAGVWLSENFKKDGPLLKSTKAILKKRFEWDYCFVFNIFDRLVAQDCPLHLHLINGEFELAQEALRRSPNLISSRDAFGKSLLHMTATYGTYTPCQMLDEHLINLNYATIPTFAELILNANIDSDLVDGLGYTAIDYALAAGSLAVANRMCDKSDLLDVNVEISSAQKAYYVLYCCMLGYRGLFRCLVKYLVHKDILDILAILAKQMYDDGDNWIEYEELLDERNYYIFGPASCFHKCIYILEDLISRIGQGRLVRDNMRSFKRKLRASDILEAIYRNDLHLAITYGTVEVVSSNIYSSCSINKRDKFLRTPLHYAVFSNSLPGVKLLVEHGADINIQCEDGNTPLHWAVNLCNKIIVAYLLDKGADFTLINNSKQTAAELAFKTDDVEIINLFPKEKVTETPAEPVDLSCHQGIVVDGRIIHILIDLANNSNATSLHTAVMSGNKAMVRLLIDEGCDINAQNYVSETALHQAVFTQNIETIEFLMENKADINICNRSGWTPLSWAVDRDLEKIVSLLLKTDRIDANNLMESLTRAIRKKNSNIVRMFLSHNINISARNWKTFLYTAVEMSSAEIILLLITTPPNDEKTVKVLSKALFLAIKNDHLEAAQLLVEHGTDINALDKDRNSALHWAALHTSKEMLSWLLRHRTDVNVPNAKGETPLFYATFSDNRDAVELLLQYGADANLLNVKGISVLHQAAKCGSIEITPLLLPAININQKNMSGDTPLHVAIKENQIEFVKFLIYNPAIDINDSLENSVLYNALELGRYTIFAELLSGYNDVDVNWQDSSTGNTFLHIAAFRHHKETIDLLLKRNADVTIRNILGETPLHLVAHSPFTDTENAITAANLIIAHNIDITQAVDSKGNTALHDAAFYNFSELTDLLLENGSSNNQRNYLGHTPLDIAAGREKKDSVKLLLGKESDIGAPEEPLFARKWEY